MEIVHYRVAICMVYKVVIYSHSIRKTVPNHIFSVCHGYVIARVSTHFSLCYFISRNLYNYTPTSLCETQRLYHTEDGQLNPANAFMANASKLCPPILSAIFGTYYITIIVCLYVNVFHYMHYLLQMQNMKSTVTCAAIFLCLLHPSTSQGEISV